MSTKENKAKHDQLNDIMFKGIGMPFKKQQNTGANKILNMMTIIANQRMKQSQSQNMVNPVAQQQPQANEVPQQPELTPEQIKNRQQFPGVFGK